MLADYEKNALSERPEARQVKLATSLAENQAAAARSNLLPQVGLHAAFEADRQHFYDRGGANWLVSIGLRWNLFNGFSDKARIEESKFARAQQRGGTAARRFRHPAAGAPRLRRSARRRRSASRWRKQPSRKRKRVCASPRTAMKPG